MTQHRHFLFIEATIKDMKPVNYNPWPGYKFTGVLRPWPQVKHSLTLTLETLRSTFTSNVKLQLEVRRLPFSICT